MAYREIVLYPDPRLKQPCAEVTAFDSGLHQLLDDMRETMYAAHGVGLAAPQVGVLQRVTVIDTSPDGDAPIDLINPQIVGRSGKVPSEEGCLSIPDYRETVSRSAAVSITAQDRFGKAITLDADGLLAICIQHELDHLDGVLFVDRLSRLKRELFRRWYARDRQQADR